MVWSRGLRWYQEYVSPMDEHSRETAWAWRPWQRLGMPCWFSSSSCAAASSALCSPEPCKNQPQSRKHSVSKSLKHLFHPGSKFLKTLKR